jgi:predicted HAD superfamily Cof-like phosphohydrolase
MSSNMRDVTRENMVAEFHNATKLDVDAPMSTGLLQLRMSLINEELDELRMEVVQAMRDLNEQDAVSTETKQKMLKELCDLMYVVSGFAVTFGLPVQPAFVRVHKSNMSKLVDGMAVFREDGKVLKGENYQPPSMEGLV